MNAFSNKFVGNDFERTHIPSAFADNAYSVFILFRITISTAARIGKASNLPDVYTQVDRTRSDFG